MNEYAKTLMFDLASGREIYDEEQGRVMSKKEASDAIRKVCFEELGLHEKSTDREIKRALKTYAAQKLFAVIEEVIDLQIATYWKDDEFFDKFVETRNMAEGDVNEFWVSDEVILNVAKIAGDHHDLVMQKLGSGSTYAIPTAVFGVKVGTDIKLFLTGRKDWNEFTEAAAKAFARKIRNEFYVEFINASQTIPVPAPLTGTGALTSANKADFDEIITKVESANEAKCVIMGTKTALKSLNKLYVDGHGVNWIANSQKESVAHSGILGDYEGTELVEIPQRFEDKELQKTLVDTDVILIMPLVDNKPIKFVDYNETSLEVTEPGQTMNDQQSYELQRRMGIGALMTKMYGVWTL